MSRGPRAFILLLLFALTFLGGIQWERQDCFVDWPNSWDDLNNAIHCPDPAPASRPATESTAA
jgi:hypothetical protein